LHVLDSLPDKSSPAIEAERLQMIFLEHFKPATFQLGRVGVNLAQVPHQENGNDCGCFCIYFARRFFQDPVATLAIIKVVSCISLQRPVLISNPRLHFIQWQIDWQHGV